MTTLIESEIKAVKSDGIVWMIKRIIMSTELLHSSFACDAPFNSSNTYQHIGENITTTNSRNGENNRLNIWKRILTIRTFKVTTNKYHVPKKFNLNSYICEAGGRHGMSSVRSCSLPPASLFLHFKAATL